MLGLFAKAMGLYELDGASEAIERSRQALAKGQMRLSLANVECLGFSLYGNGILGCPKKLVKG